MIQASCIKAQQTEIKTKLSQQLKNNSIIVGQKTKLYSKVLGEEKEIYVSLPKNYHQHKHHYPIVYVLEAERLFSVTNAITGFMASQSLMPQTIVVGITNGTHLKRNEMAVVVHGGKPKKYLKFLKDELIPYIDQKYRANNHRTIIGMSTTNGLVFEAFFSEPYLFKGYIGLSTYLEWNYTKEVSMSDKLAQAMSDPHRPASTLYLGRPASDLHKKPIARKITQEINQQLKKIPTTNVTYKIELLENHKGYGMALIGIQNGFRLIYPLSKIVFPYNNPEIKDPVAKVKQHYQNQSKAYGFKVYPVEEEYLNGSIRVLTLWKKSQELLQILKLAVHYYPASAYYHLQLAKAYQSNNQIKLATQTAQKAIKLAAKYHPDELTSYQQQLQEILSNK